VIRQKWPNPVVERVHHPVLHHPCLAGPQLAAQGNRLVYIVTEAEIIILAAATTTDLTTHRAEQAICAARLLPYINVLDALNA
jgi:hypothetical protein